MPRIVKPPDNQVMLANVVQLLLQHWVTRQRSLIVGMVIKSRLVGNDQIVPTGHSLLKDGICVHERGCDAGDRSIGITGL